MAEQGHTDLGGGSRGPPRLTYDPAVFPRWKKQMIAWLYSSNLEAALEDDTTAAYTKVMAARQKKFLSYIHLSFHGEELFNIIDSIDFETEFCGLKAWETLIEFFENKSSTRVATIARELVAPQPSNETAIAYFDRITRQRQQLSDIGHTMSDGLFAAIALGGLREDYRQLQLSIYAATGTSSVDLTVLGNTIRIASQSFDHSTANSHGSIGPYLAAISSLKRRII